MSSARIALFVDIIVPCIACALIAASFAMTQTWFDHHFLPSFWTPRDEIVTREHIARAAVFILGLLVFGVRKPARRVVENDAHYSVTIPLAIVLAIVTAETVLRLRATPHVDVRANWFTTAPIRRDHYLGEQITYALDRNGYRVASETTTVDFGAPTLVFTGESIVTGLKLQWDDTIPAQTSALLGLQAANIAIPGLATDESYLRLKSELPRFRKPVAVVALFAPSLFDRNLDDEPASQWRLLSIARRVIPYRTSGEIDRGVARTRDALRGIVAIARERGAVALIVVPEFGTEEEPGERELRQRILDDAHLPYVRVTVDPEDRVENDGHPDSDGARTMANAIATALRPQLR